ncbi:Oidioi.mRNA.OKI2018_I69.chr2.g5804.t1.cds [Oikopleura dioica]|uniref:Oidioi.mRNA.OKI2018_I69.chr2.g5804.t1.cds n=1 Tax=Oikopleura dioica TaxID=34765 RepID=A0ABN7T200_OIKDI|nr:Oidioi.mRNA.OKI2018_I69.chr2.g5804.t1.cds [Oikopleura dioica]
MTVAHYETLERVFVEVSKEEPNKDFQDSEWKTRLRETVFKVLRQQRKLEQQNEDLARLNEEVARKKRKVAVEKMLHDKLDRLREQIDLHLDQLERIIRHYSLAPPEKVATLTTLALERVHDVIKVLWQEFERIHDELSAIPDDQSFRNNGRDQKAEKSAQTNGAICPLLDNDNATIKFDGEIGARPVQARIREADHGFPV